MTQDNRNQQTGSTGDGPVALTAPPATTGQALQHAWIVGRRLNRLRFQLQQAWLLFDDELHARALESFDELAQALRPLSGQIEIRDELQQRVLASKDSCQPMFTDWAAESFESNLNELLGRYWNDGNLTLASAREEFCNDWTKWPAHVVGDLQARIERHLSEAEKRMLRLGGLVDQAVHPRELHRVVYADDDASAVTQAPSASGRLGDQPYRRVAEEDRFRPNQRCDRVDALPDDAWRREVEQRWNELPLPQGVLDAVFRERSGEGTAGDMVDTLEQAVVEALNRPAEHDSAEEGRGYLGLQIDAAKRIVVRGRERAEFGKKDRPFSLVHSLFRAGRTGIRRDQLLDELAPDDDLEENNVNQWKKQANKILQAIRVQVASTGGSAPSWILEDA